VQILTTNSTDIGLSDQFDGDFPASMAADRYCRKIDPALKVLLLYRNALYCGYVSI